MAKAGRALVIGSGMAGLLAARVLADHFDEVLVLERDAEGVTGGARPGVGQSAQVHVLLAGGQQAINRLLPGFDDDLRRAGAVELTDIGVQRALFMGGAWIARRPNGISNMQLTRPLLERAVRDRVTAWPGVAFRYGVTFDSLIVADGRVRGVRARSGEGAAEDIEADFVVDAAGRGSFAAQEFKANGFEPPEEDVVGLDFGYATGLFEAPPGFDPTCLSMLVAPVAPRSEGVLFSAVEGGLWLIALAGRGAARPPTDLPAFRAFAQRAPHPVAGEWTARAKPASEIKGYRFPSSVHRRFDKLAAHLEGYLPIGDAICSFNPVYGQGMSVAALEAEALQAVLAGGVRDGLWRDFHPRAAAAIAGPWAAALALDLHHPETQAPRPQNFDAQAGQFRWAQSLVLHDPVLGRRMTAGVNMVGPPFAPGMPDLLAAQARRWLGLAPFGRAPGFADAGASAEQTAAA